VSTHVTKQQILLKFVDHDFSRRDALANKLFISRRLFR